MEYTFEIRKLSSLFYTNYPQSEFPEIERKHTRGYATLLIDTHDGYLICIPFRSHISHESAYMFKNSVRSRTNDSGLDYTKICIIDNLDYIDDVPGIVDTDEYIEVRDNLDLIVEEACNYIEEYVSHKKGIALLSNRQFRKKYWFTTLKYFHKELNI
ncbi:MAG: hypothetical protein IJ106_12825 [Parasporobacterium sp.]|nr:hypothetical protein [Parasporobacterium sp.]